jgi:hypothetical protein
MWWVVLALGLWVGRQGVAVDFIRGDANGDGRVSASDGYAVVVFLFDGAVSIDCLNAADADDSGTLNLADGIGILSFVVLNGPPPPPPYPEPGADPTETSDLSLDCSSYGTGSPLVDAQAALEVMDVTPTQGSEGTLVLAVALSSSVPLAGYAGKIRFPPGLLQGANEAAHDLSGTLGTGMSGAAAQDDVVSFGFVSSFFADRAIPPGVNQPVLEITACLRPGTAAGEYPLLLEEGELIDAATARTISPALQGGILDFEGEVNDEGNCQSEEPPPPGPGPVIVEHADFSLSIDAAAGAVGDVVEVSVLFGSRLASPNGFLLSMAVCHDPRFVEILGEPAYTDEFLSLLGAMGVAFLPVEEGTLHGTPDRGHGFLLIAGLDSAAYSARFPSDRPLPVMTVYYRVKGTAGQTSELAFCDGVLQRARLIDTRNFLYHEVFDPASAGYIGYEFRPAVKDNGILTVLDGPATHPDRPPEPPDARVYPEPLSDAEVNFRVRITGAQTLPGAVEVPVEVYATADVEYSSIQIPIDFDERYLRLARAEEHFIGGVVLIENTGDNYPTILDQGFAVIYSGSGVDRRRLAAEGEEILAATLYFDVLEAAAEISETTLTVRTSTESDQSVRYQPWIGVRYQTGDPSNPEVRVEVAPIEITNGRLNIIGDVSYFIRGDANDDGIVDIADPIATLGYLFLGVERLPCRDAADSNDDGLLDVSDSITTLAYLFLGGQALPPPNERPGEDPTLDGLGCLRFR